MSCHLAKPTLEVITGWVETQHDVRGLALAGSYARNAPRPDSDLDLVILAENPARFRDGGWPATIEWSRAGVQLARWVDEEYGIVWSRRIWLEPQYELEIAFAPLSWAGVSPVDRGTERVVSDGFRVLYDPDRLLESLAAAVLGRLDTGQNSTRAAAALALGTNFRRFHSS